MAASSSGEKRVSEHPIGAGKYLFEEHAGKSAASFLSDEYVLSATSYTVGNLTVPSVTVQDTLTRNVYIYNNNVNTWDLVESQKKIKDSKPDVDNKEHMNKVIVMGAGKITTYPIAALAELAKSNPLNMPESKGYKDPGGAAMLNSLQRFKKHYKDKAAPELINMFEVNAESKEAGIQLALIKLMSLATKIAEISPTSPFFSTVRRGAAKEYTISQEIQKAFVKYDFQSQNSQKEFEKLIHEILDRARPLDKNADFSTKLDTVLNEHCAREVESYMQKVMVAAKAVAKK